MSRIWKDRISHENLERLLDALGRCDVVSEATVSNLSKSLHVLCGLSTSRNISNIIHFSENTITDLNEGINDGENGNVPSISGRRMIEGDESGNDILVDSYHAELDTFTLNHDQVDRVNNNDAMVFRPEIDDIEDRISLSTDELEFSDDLALDRSSDSSDEELWDDESCEDDDFDFPLYSLILQFRVCCALISSHVIFCDVVSRDLGLLLWIFEIGFG